MIHEEFFSHTLYFFSKQTNLCTVPFHRHEKKSNFSVGIRNCIPSCPNHEGEGEGVSQNYDATFRPCLKVSLEKFIQISKFWFSNDVSFVSTFVWKSSLQFVLYESYMTMNIKSLHLPGSNSLYFTCAFCVYSFCSLTFTLKRLCNKLTHGAQKSIIILKTDERITSPTAILQQN